MTPTRHDLDCFRLLDRNVDDAVAKLHHLFKRLIDVENNLARELAPSGFKEEFGGVLQDDLTRVRSLIQQKLADFLAFPPHHSNHFDLLSKLAEDRGAREKLVFIMTKFPEGKSKASKQLNNVIALVRLYIRKHGYTPIMADNRRAPMLWENVELHLLACPRGVAILEDRSRRELNPNVAMEWGWMRGMGKDVLRLVEDKFKYRRADWAGVIEHRFTWSDPRPGIKDAIKDWLSPQPAATTRPRRRGASQPARRSKGPAARGKTSKGSRSKKGPRA